MPHNKAHRPHRTVIFLGVLLVLILAHLVLLLAQAQPSPPHLRVEGRWAAVRQSLRLPPLAAHVELPSKLPPTRISLCVSSRFDLKRKRALEESSFSTVDNPPQLYFAADALLEETAAEKVQTLAEPLENPIERRGSKGTTSEG
jgi:hypothetical protein